MKIIVIGATGHIGTWLVPRLVRNGHEVVAVSRGIRRPYRDADEWEAVRLAVIDRDTAEAEGTFGGSIANLAGDVVIDLTCFTPASATTIVTALRDRVEHFLHCGTLWVHGIPQSRPYDETARREPFGDYGIQKAAIEAYLVRESETGFPATVLHPGHITGPGWIPINPAGNLDAAVFDLLAQGKQVTLPDDGKATLQHVHADDVAQAFELAVEQREKSVGHSFHVAAMEPVTMRAYAEEAARWFGREAHLSFLPWKEWKTTVSERDAALTLDHVMHSPHASIGKARRILGFEPRFTALDAVHDAVNGLSIMKGRTS